MAQLANINPNPNFGVPQQEWVALLNDLPADQERRTNLMTWMQQMGGINQFANTTPNTYHFVQEIQMIISLKNLYDGIMALCQPWMPPNQAGPDPPIWTWNQLVWMRMGQFVDLLPNTVAEFKDARSRFMAMMVKAIYNPELYRGVQNWYHQFSRFCLDSKMTSSLTVATTNRNYITSVRAQRRVVARYMATRCLQVLRQFLRVLGRAHMAYVIPVLPSQVWVDANDGSVYFLPNLEVQGQQLVVHAETQVRLCSFVEEAISIPNQNLLEPISAAEDNLPLQNNEVGGGRIPADVIQDLAADAQRYDQIRQWLTDEGFLNQANMAQLWPQLRPNHYTQYIETKRVLQMTDLFVQTPEVFEKITMPDSQVHNKTTVLECLIDLASGDYMPDVFPPMPDNLEAVISPRKLFLIDLVQELVEQFMPEFGDRVYRAYHKFWHLCTLMNPTLSVRVANENSDIFGRTRMQTRYMVVQMLNNFETGLLPFLNKIAMASHCQVGFAVEVLLNGQVRYHQGNVMVECGNLFERNLHDIPAEGNQPFQV